MTRLVENALFGTALILAAALLRRVLKGRLLPEARLALWAACLLRLLAPVFPVSGLSLWGALNRTGTAAWPPRPVPGVGVGELVELTVPGTGTASPGPVEPAGAAFPWEVAVLWVWIGAGVLLAARYVLSWNRTRRAVAEAIPLGRDDPRYVPLPRCARLREGVMEGAPLTFGAVRPTVVLSPGLSGAALECVLAHEGVHARRRDNLWHYAMALALVVYWWDPAVWLMARLLRRDIELACDRAAVRKLGADRRAEYAETLVFLSTQGESSAFSHAFSRKLTEERIVAIMKYKKMTALGVALTLLLVSSVTVGFATEPIEKGIPQDVGNEPIVFDLGDDGFPIYAYGNEEKMGYTLIELDNDDENGIDPQAANINTDFTVNVGKSFVRTFNMDVWFNEPHDAFKVHITETNGVPYKVIVVNNKGYERVFAEKTGETLFALIGDPDANYTLYIVNTGSKDLTGHITVSSYYF